MTISLKAQPLTKTGFAPFGDVIETDGAHHFPINQGTTERYHDLANLDTNRIGGNPIVSIFEANPRPAPIPLQVMERHPIGSQAFYPLQPEDWLVVVADSHNPLAPENIKAFRATGHQGVNYAPGTWHHPLLVLKPASRFLVIDRKGPGENLEERAFEDAVVVEV